MQTIERIIALLEEKDIVPAKMMKELGFSNGLFSQWKSGLQNPSAEKVFKIADYLGCSTDYLLGRTDVPNINGNVQFNGNNHNGIQATVNTGNVVNNEPKLEELETVLLDTFRTFKPTEKVKIVCDLVKEAEKNSSTAGTVDE